MPPGGRRERRARKEAEILPFAGIAAGSRRPKGEESKKIAGNSLFYRNRRRLPAAEGRRKQEKKRKFSLSPESPSAPGGRREKKARK